METLLSLPLLYKQTAAENCQQNNLAKNDFSFRICWWNDMTLVQLPPERRSLFFQRIEFRRMASSVTFCMKFTKKCKWTADIPIYVFVSELWIWTVSFQKKGNLSRHEIEKSYQKIQNFKNVPGQLGVSLIAWRVRFYPNSERLTVASEGSKRLFSCQTWSLDCPTPWRMFTMTFTGSWSSQLDGT